MSATGFPGLVASVFLAGYAFGLFGTTAFCWNRASDENVNSRYTVESVQIHGEDESKLSGSLRDEIKQRIGEKFDPQIFEDLARRVRKELQARGVATKLAKGANPDSVQVVLEVNRRSIELNASPSRFAYHSRQGWTGDLTAEGMGFRFGILSDGDQLLERYSGFRAGYGHSIFTPAVRFSFLYESFHQQWNGATVEALAASPGDVPGVYRERRNFYPSLSISLAEPLTLTVGFSFQRFETQYPLSRTESSHALVNTLRYRQAWGDSAFLQQRLTGEDNMRVATRSLDSDFAYARNQASIEYVLTPETEQVALTFLAGTVGGRAPLFDRFVLGNTSTLRGWNKYDVAPLGGNRVVHGSVEYRHKLPKAPYVMTFYDTGAIWDRGSPRAVRHAAGVGLRSKEGLFLLVAFPLREGRTEPIFMTGANF